MGILGEDRGAGEAEEKGTWESILDSEQHSATAVLARTRYTSVALINNEYDTLLIDLVDG